MTQADKSTVSRQAMGSVRRPNTSHWSRTPSQWIILAIWILAVHGCAIYLFTTGFFLTRFELKSSSECTVFPDTHRNLTDPGQFPALQNLKESGGCWYPPRFRKLVIIVIDALRFDFVAPFDKDGALDPAGPAPGPQKIEKESDEVLYYRNTLPVIHETLRNQPDKSHLFQFIADPPTVTMQRLKGLTTGGLPSFLDIKDNFDSSAVQEDNIVRQWKKQNRSSVFMGDDTWVSLFPKEFTQSYGYPSFNVKDLYTVDNGCIEHLLPELTTNKWDILISHFLGVDHVGHTYQANHPLMRSKLTQMNGIVTDVMRAIDRSPHANDTLFLLLGDHGMTPDGNHGGNSNSETVAAMFAYSPGAPFANLKELEATVKHYEQKLLEKGKLRPQGDRAPEEEDDSAASTRCPSAQYSSSSSLLSRPGVQTDLYSQIPQIDLVPTLSLLMGVPIPFNSLGSLVPELFMSGSGDGNAGSHIQSLRSLIQALHINSWQLHRYLEEYSTTAESFPYSKMKELQGYFHDANELFDHLFPASGSARAQTHNTVDCDRGTDESCVLEHHRLAMLYRQFLTVSATMCREKWTTFNIGLMHWGCVILVLLAASHAFFLYMHHASMSDSLSLLTTNPDSLGNAYLLDRTITDGAPRRPGATKWRGFLLRPLIYGLLGALTGLSAVSALVVTDQVRLLGISNAVEARSAQHRSHPTGDMLMPAFIMKFSLPLFTIACGVGSSVGWLIGLTQIWLQRRRKLALLRSAHSTTPSSSSSSSTPQGSTLTRTTAVSEAPAVSGEKADPRTWWTNALRYFAFFCFSIYMQGLFSNSFIMHEARLSLFLTVSLTVAYTIASASGVAPVTRWPFAMRSSATRIVVPIIVFLVLCRLTASITWLFKGPFSFPEEFISLTSSTLNSLQALQSPALSSAGSYPLWKCILFGVRVYVPLLLFPIFLRRFVLLRYSPQRRDSFSSSAPSVTTMAVSPAAVYPSPTPVSSTTAFFPPPGSAAPSSLFPLTRAQVRRWICNFVVPVSCVCIVLFWNYHFCADPRDHTRPPPGVIPSEALASATPSSSSAAAPSSHSPFSRVDAKTVDWLPRFVYFSCLSAMALLMYCEDPTTPFPPLVFSATASSADIADAKGYERVRGCYCLSDAMSTDLICFMALLMLLLALMIGSLFPLIAGVIISYLLSLTSAPATHFSSARYAVSRALGSTAVFIVRVLASCNLSFFEAMLAVFLGIHIFFSTGHDNKFETLQVSAPFVGFESFTVPRAIAMTLCNTFVGQILVLVAMPLTIALRSRLTYGLVLQTWRRLKAGEEVKDTGAESIVEDESEEQTLLGDHYISPIEPEALTRNVMFMHCVKGLLTFSFFYCIRVALSAINVTIQRRHLMVWAIFAPKYVFDAASVLTMDILIIIALLLSWRFTRSAVVNTNTPAPLPSLVVSLSNDTKSKKM